MILLSVALCEFSFRCYSTDGTHNFFDPWTVTGWLVDEQPWPSSWTRHCRWVGKTCGGAGAGGGGELWRRPRESRVRGRVRHRSLYKNLWQETDCRWPLPTLALTALWALPSLVAAEEAGPTSRVGFMIRRKTKRVRERVRESMCFPQARQQLRDNDLCISQNSGISKCYI